MPVETLTDQLTGSFRSWFGWSRVKTQAVGSVVNEDRASATYNIAPGTGPGQADLAYGVTRTVPANSGDEFDLRDLEEVTLGATVPFRFRRVRLLRLVNKATTAGRRLFVGADPGNPTTRYAADVGPGSEWTAVNQLDGWTVTADNSIVRVANPNDASVAYDLYVIGVAATVPGKPPTLTVSDPFENDSWVAFVGVPADDGGFAITDYRVYVNGVLDETFPYEEQLNQRGFIAVEPGDVVRASAVNAIGEGPLSDPFTIPEP